MTFLIYFGVVFFAVFQSATTKLYNRRSGASSVFNAIKASSSLALFFAMTVVDFDLHLPTVLFGTLYGGLLCLSMYSGYRALCLGPMAMTSMLVSFSVAIPLIWGLTFGGEAITLLETIALPLLFAAIISTNFDKIVAQRKKEVCKTKTSYKLWLLFVGTTFLANGICSILQKEHQTVYPGEYNGEFMFFAMLLCTVVFSVIIFIKTPIDVIRNTKGKYLGALSGISNGASNFLILTLAGLENASVLFPIISLGTTLGALLCGRFIFKEKLKINHYIALVIGMLAVVLLKL